MSAAGYRSLDESWTLPEARAVVTEGTPCLMHGYTNCGICAASVARWLLGMMAPLSQWLQKSFKSIDDGKSWCDHCGCEWGKCTSASGCFCNLLAALPGKEKG